MEGDEEESKPAEEWAAYHSATSMTFGDRDYAERFGVLGTGNSWAVSDVDPDVVRLLFNRQVWKWKRAKRRYRMLARVVDRQLRPVHSGEWLEIMEDCAACLNTLLGMQWTEPGFVDHNTVELGECIFTGSKLSEYLEAAEYASFKSTIDIFTKLVRHPSRARYIAARLTRDDAYRSIAATARIWVWVFDNSGLQMEDDKLFGAPDHAS